jgi:4-amino-4-deoxy-L-arabinose transferase-like glycosyltransferase
MVNLYFGILNWAVFLLSFALFRHGPLEGNFVTMYILLFAPIIALAGGIRAVLKLRKDKSSQRHKVSLILHALYIVAWVALAFYMIDNAMPQPE